MWKNVLSADTRRDGVVCTYIQLRTLTVLSFTLLKFLALAIEVTEVTNSGLWKKNCNNDQPFEIEDVKAHPQKIIELD